MLKEAISSPTQEFIESIRQSIEERIDSNASTVETGREFLRWVVTKLFDASEDDFDLHYTDGKNDHGIDFWIPDPSDEGEGGVIQLFQVKYGKSHKPESIYKFGDDIKKFFKMNPNNVERDGLKDVLREKIEKKLEPELIYVTDNNVDNPEKFKGIKVYGLEQIEEKLWDDLFGKPKGQVAKLKLEKCMAYDHSIMGAVSLQELSRFVRKNKSYIFESNIRKFLGSKKTKVNKLLQETINKNPEDVYKYNNGITLVAKKFKDLGNYEIELHEPQIVNGAQTANTIATELQFYDNRIGSVPITILQEDSKDMKDKITRFRNSQNAVKGKDLISLEATHENIHGQLSNIGYYYEHQAGGWLSLPDKEKKKFTGNEIYNKYLLKENKLDVKIDAKDAIQTMVAGITQEPTKPYGSVARYMPGGANYADVFNNDLKEDWRFFLYPYLVKCYCVNKFKYGKQDPDLPELKYARLLFVTAYFRILSQFIIQKDFDKIKKEPKILEPYFKNFEANSRLLAFTHEMIKHYVAAARLFIEDHKEKITTLHNFFARYAWDESLQKNFVHHVTVYKDEIKKIKESFKK